jgi:cytochrome c1
VKLAAASVLIVAAVLVAAAVASIGPILGNSRAVQEAEGLTGGDVGRGRVALGTYGCGTCHQVPGVRAAIGLVGPPLTHLANRMYVAGVLPNTPERLIDWIQHPRHVDPRTAMPELGVDEADARDIAAYLYSLK